MPEKALMEINITYLLRVYYIDGFVSRNKCIFGFFSAFFIFIFRGPKARPIRHSQHARHSVSTPAPHNVAHPRE